MSSTRPLFAVPPALLLAAIVPLLGCSQNAPQGPAGPVSGGSEGASTEHDEEHDHAAGVEHEHAHADDASVERAIEITTQMLEAYRRAKSYADHATYVEEAVYRGEGVAHQIPYYEMTVALERPNRLRLTLAESVAD